MPWIAPVVGGIASVGSGLIGASSAASEREAAQAASAAALKEIQDTGTPPDESLPIVLRHFEQAGILTPEMENAITQEYSKMSGVQVDPQLRTAQMDALGMLAERGRTGFGPEERAAFNKVQQEVARNSEAKRQQIMQNMQARGMAGGGAELAAQLSASQAGDALASTQGDEIAAAASRNALSAMSQYGQLGGQIRNEDFGEASARAKAEDEMNRFNVQSQQAVQQRNVGARNIAQESNLNRAQTTADRNVSVDNSELLRQSQARQQLYYDKLAKAQAAANALNKQASNLAQQGQQKAENAVAIGSGIAAGAGEVNKTLFPSLYGKKAATKKDEEEE